MDELSPPAETALKAVLGALARKAITVAGTALVAHGIIDQDTVTAASEPLAQYAVGAALIGGSTLWSIARARWTHTRFAAAWAALNSAPAADQAGTAGSSHA